LDLRVINSGRISTTKSEIRREGERREEGAFEDRYERVVSIRRG
jgi:hypothetical protein